MFSPNGLTDVFRYFFYNMYSSFKASTKEDNPAFIFDSVLFNNLQSKFVLIKNPVSTYSSLLKLRAIFHRHYDTGILDPCSKHAPNLFRVRILWRPWEAV